MSLSPGEREVLNAIEGQLSRSDPRLAAMLDSWTAGRVRGWLARLPVPAQWRSPRELTRVLIVAVGLSLVVGLAIVSVLRAPAPRSPGRGSTPYSNQGTRGTQGTQGTPASDYPYGAYP